MSQIPTGVRRRVRRSALVLAALLGCVVAAPAASQAATWHTSYMTLPGATTTYLASGNVGSVNVLTTWTPPLWTGIQTSSGWVWDTDWSLFDNVYVELAVANGRPGVVNWASPTVGIQYSLYY